jgi:hypothetical protein
MGREALDKRRHIKNLPCRAGASPAGLLMRSLRVPDGPRCSLCLEGRNLGRICIAKL